MTRSGYWSQTRKSRRGAMAIAAGAGVGVTSLALVGCGDDDDADPSGASGGTADATATPTSTSERPVSGGTLKLSGTNGVAVVDPHKSLSLVGASDLWSSVANTLIRNEFAIDTLGPALAASWESPDPSTVVFKLKKGVLFQQASLAAGRELDAQDVVETLERVRTKDPTFVAANRFLTVDTITATDSTTVTLKLKSPDANLLSWLSHPVTTILPRETLKKYGANITEIDALAGTGAFIADRGSYQPGISLKLTRNPQYGVGTPPEPYLAGIDYVWIADAAARNAALKSGAIELTYPLAAEVENYRNSKYQMLSTKDRIVVAQHVSANTQLAPTNDPRVRAALHRALDREELKLIVGDGYAGCPIVLGLYPRYFLGEGDWENKPGFMKDKKVDIADAKKLLEAAGVDPTKTTLKMNYADIPAFKVHAAQALAVQGILQRNLGLKIEMNGTAQGVPYATKDAVTNAKAHLVNVASGANGHFILDDTLWSHLHSTASPLNSSVWSDPKTDELTAKARSTLNVDERKQVFHEIQRYLMQDDVLPVFPAARQYDWFVAPADLRGWAAPSTFASNYAWQFDRVWRKV